MKKSELLKNAVYTAISQAAAVKAGQTTFESARKTTLKWVSWLPEGTKLSDYFRGNNAVSVDPEISEETIVSLKAEAWEAIEYLDV